MSLSKLCFKEVVNEDIWRTRSSPYRQEVNIRKYASSIPIRKIRGKSRNQEKFALTFPMPGRNDRAKPSEFKILGKNNRKIEYGWNPALIRISHSRKNFQHISPYLDVMMHIPSRCHCAHPILLKKVETKRVKDDRKITVSKNESVRKTYPHPTNQKSKIMVNVDKSKRKIQAGKASSKSYVSGLLKIQKSKSQTCPEPKDFNVASKTKSGKDKHSVNVKKSKTKFVVRKHNKKQEAMKIPKKNADSKSANCSIYSSKANLARRLDQPAAESMKLGIWLNNCSNNNSKKPVRKTAKKSSDAESSDAKKDAKMGKKAAKRDDNKKDVKKDTGSTDAESGDSTEVKKAAKKDKKATKKDDKVKDAKSDTVSDSGESKDAEQDEKKDKKALRKDNRKKDAVSTESGSESGSEKERKDSKQKPVRNTTSTDADSESEGDPKARKEGAKRGKADAAKADKAKVSKKSVESAQSESDSEPRKERKGSKKKAKRSAHINAESTDVESAKAPSKLQAKKRDDASDTTSPESRKQVSERRSGVKMTSKKTTFSENNKKPRRGRVPPSRERPPLPPCGPSALPAKAKRFCRCKVPPPPPKPKCAPLPEAEWIQKLL